MDSRDDRHTISAGAWGDKKREGIRGKCSRCCESGVMGEEERSGGKGEKGMRRRGESGGRVRGTRRRGMLEMESREE